MTDLEEYEGNELLYGECPICGDMCQPDGGLSELIIPFEEYVVCCDCKITWTLHVEDESDKLDETEAWREYRISDIESIADHVTKLPECE